MNLSNPPIISQPGIMSGHMKNINNFSRALTKTQYITTSEPKGRYMMTEQDKVAFNFFVNLIPIEYKFDITLSPLSRKKFGPAFRRFIVKTMYDGFLIKVTTDFNHMIKLVYCYKDQIMYDHGAYDTIVWRHKSYRINFNKYLGSIDYMKSFFTSHLVKTIKHGFWMNEIKDMVHRYELNPMNTLTKHITPTNSGLDRSLISSYHRYDLDIVYRKFRKSLYLQYMENNILLEPLKNIVISYLCCIL